MFKGFFLFFWFLVVDFLPSSCHKLTDASKFTVPTWLFACSGWSFRYVQQNRAKYALSETTTQRAEFIATTVKCSNPEVGSYLLLVLQQNGAVPTISCLAHFACSYMWKRIFTGTVKAADFILIMLPTTIWCQQGEHYWLDLLVTVDFM